ncbi:acyl-CoA N-acyltransferase [Apiospora rasikravindrae]|uniref:Acyl-CoA N-acyltransferase n=1 Tax=Apiospora rasikravindrae TaxID=990691 RepID=A0ABR1SEX0_9PEZI
MASHPAISATAFPALSSLTYEQLQQLYVKNKAELTKHVNEAMGVEEKFYGGHDWFVRWWEAPPHLMLQQQQQRQQEPINSSGGSAITNLAISNLAQDHNGLEHQSIPASEQSEAVNMVKNRFRRRLQRFNWVTGPQRQPELERVLEGSGFSCQEEEPVMCADLTAGENIAGNLVNFGGDGVVPSGFSPPSSRLSTLADLQAAQNDMRRSLPPHYASQPPPAAGLLPEGVVIEPTSSLGIIGWVSAWAHGAPECDVLHWTKVYARVATSVYRDQFRMFAARRGNECIGTGYLHCHSGIASIHSLFVHPAHRRRGIGRALALYAVQEARSMGYQVATLTATAPAMDLLKKLGFKEFGAVKLYTWYPVVLPSATTREQGRKGAEEQQGRQKQELVSLAVAEASAKMKELEIQEAEDEDWEFV